MKRPAPWLQQQALRRQWFSRSRWESFPRCRVRELHQLRGRQVATGHDERAPHPALNGAPETGWTRRSTGQVTDVARYSRRRAVSMGPPLSNSPARYAQQPPDIRPQSAIRFCFLAYGGGDAVKTAGDNVQFPSRELPKTFVRPAIGGGFSATFLRAQWHHCAGRPAR